MRIILSLSIIFLNLSVHAQTLNIDSAAIESYFVNWDKTDSLGGVFAIIQKEKMIYSKCFGQSDLRSNSPIDLNTNFRIASTSKQFVAACIHLLESDNKLRITDCLDEYLPNYPKYLHPVTIEQLLHHTSGVRPFYEIGYLKGYVNYEFSEKEVFQWINMQTDLQVSPGQEYAYSNTNYWLLGKIIESVLGLTLEEFSRQRIFQPLGMRETKFVRNHNSIIKNRAYGYGIIKDSLEVIEEPLETIGESGIYTNLNDLMKWVNGFYRQGFYEKSLFSKMIYKGTLNNGDTIDYASGVWVENYRGLQTISHGGTERGFQSEMMYFPECDITIIILCNQNDLPPTWYTWKIADIILKDKLLPIITNNETDLIDYFYDEKIMGYYIDKTTFQTIEIRASDSTVYLVSSSGNSIPLSTDNSGQWFSSHPPILQCEFDTISMPTMLNLTIGGAYTKHYHRYKPYKHTNSELERFIGSYHCKELNIFYKIYLIDNDLFIDINNNSYYLESRMQNSFCFDQYLIEFNLSKKGNSISFNMSNERLKNLEFQKLKKHTTKPKLH